MSQSKNQKNMRKLIILKTILDFLFIMLMLGSVLIILLMGTILFSGDGMAEIPIKISLLDESIEKWTTGLSIVLVFGIIAYVLFVYAIYQLKTIVRLFMKTTLFHDSIIKGFRHIGSCFVLISFFIYVPKLIYRVFGPPHEFKLMFGGDFFNSFWFILSMGLFFMVLGNIFKIAKHAKEENELTV